MTQQRKVVLDCIIFGIQQYGGISNYWKELANGLNTGPGEAAGLLMPSASTATACESLSPELSIDRYERIPACLSRYLSALPSHPHAPIHTSYYRRPRRSRRPYIVTVYDFVYERFSRGMPRAAHSIQKRLSITAADSIICISESTKRDVLDFVPGVNEEALTVVPLAVDHAVYFPGSNFPCSSLPKRPVLLFVGQRVRYKRFDLAIAATELVPDLILGIVGPALSPQEEMTLGRTLGCRWEFYGRLSNEQLRVKYATAHAFIFPSDYEGFGLPVLEAMASGCPVVAARGSSLVEVGARAGLYPETQCAHEYASLLCLLFDDEIRLRHIEMGTEQASRYLWSTTVSETRRVYASMGR